MLFSDVVVGHSAFFMTETLLFLVEAKRSYHTKTYPFCNLKTCISWKIHDVLLRFSFFPFEFFQMWILGLQALVSRWTIFLIWKEPDLKIKPVKIKTTIREMGIYPLRPRLYQHLIPTIRRLVAQEEERGAKHLTHDEANYFLVAIVSEWRKIIKFDGFFLFESIFGRTTILLYQFATLRQKILLYVLREHNNCFVLDLSITFFSFLSFSFFFFFFWFFFFGGYAYCFFRFLFFIYTRQILLTFQFLARPLFEVLLPVVSPRCLNT